MPTLTKSSSVAVGGSKYCKCSNVACQWSLSLAVITILGSDNSVQLLTEPNVSPAHCYCSQEGSKGKEEHIAMPAVLTVLSHPPP